MSFISAFMLSALYADPFDNKALISFKRVHKEGSKAFNRYRKIDEETNRQTMSYLE